MCLAHPANAAPPSPPPFLFFLNGNGISPILPFRKYSPAPVNITSPPLCAPFFHMRRQTFREHASAPVQLPASICGCIKPDTLQRGGGGGESHYFSFCLPLLCAAKRLKGSDQPTITIRNGFSASSTSLEACLRSGGYPHTQPPPQPLPPQLGVPAVEPRVDV